MAGDSKLQPLRIRLGWGKQEERMGAGLPGVKQTGSTNETRGNDQCTRGKRACLADSRSNIVSTRWQCFWNGLGCSILYSFPPSILNSPAGWGSLATLPDSSLTLQRGNIVCDKRKSKLLPPLRDLFQRRALNYAKKKWACLKKKPNVLPTFLQLWKIKCSNRKSLKSPFTDHREPAPL